MKIAIVSGKSEGPTKLNAFDNALSDAGIGEPNKSIQHACRQCQNQ